jgi:hypothetical protein
MPIRLMKQNQSQFLLNRFLLGLMGAAPILLLSIMAQAVSASSKSIPTKAIQQAAAQSADRAVLARQQPTAYPNSILARAPIGDPAMHGTCGMVCDHEGAQLPVKGLQG